MSARHPETQQSVRVARATTVATATITSVAGWLIARFALGIEISSPAFGPEQPSAAIGVGRVALTALIVSGAGWALLAGLERLTDRARTVWTAIAGLVLLISLGGPFGGDGITTANRVALLVMHLAVGFTLIPGLYRSAAPSQARETSETTAATV